MPITPTLSTPRLSRGEEENFWWLCQDASRRGALFNSTRINASQTNGAGHSGQNHTPPPEPIAVAMIESRLAFLSSGQEGNFSDHESRRINVTCFRLQDLAQTTTRINPAGQPVVRAADHWQTV